MQTAVASIEHKSTVMHLRTLCVLLTLALLILGLMWEWWLAPLRPGGSWLAIKVLPLCLPLAGLLKHRLYTYRWLSLLVWLYVAEGAVRLWPAPALVQALALAEIVLALALFVACAIYIRKRLSVMASA